MRPEDYEAARAARRTVRLKEIHDDEQLALDSLHDFPHDHWAGLLARVTLWVSRQHRRIMWQDNSPPGLQPE